MHARPRYFFLRCHMSEKSCRLTFFVHMLAFFCVTCHVSRLKIRNPREVASHLASTFFFSDLLDFPNGLPLGRYGRTARASLIPMRFYHWYSTGYADWRTILWAWHVTCHGDFGRSMGVGAGTCIFGCIVYINIYYKIYIYNYFL